MALFTCHAEHFLKQKSFTLSVVGTGKKAPVVPQIEVPRQVTVLSLGETEET